jgi:aminodeoxyfutalosine deaminase
LTPDIPRGFPLEAAELTVTHALAHASRGIVGIGLGGPESEFPPGPFRPVFARARDGGLGSVPHAGESEGPASVRSALDDLGADRIRHGIRSVEDPALLRELADRGVVLDVCPTSNLRTVVVPSLAEHPLPGLLAAGVACTINTDDPAMFGTDLGGEHEVARGLGASARASYQAGVQGALCDEATKAELRRIDAGFDWSAVPDPAGEKAGRKDQ